MTHKSIAASALILMLNAGKTPAATYYVDKSSLGGACADANAGTSFSAPWCNIAKANATVKAGDTVMIRGSSYAQSIAPATNGTSALPIVYQRYSNEQVLISAIPAVSF